MLCSISQRSLDEIITPLSRRNDVATSFRRNNDVIIASCAYRDILLQLLLTYLPMKDTTMSQTVQQPADLVAKYHCEIVVLEPNFATTTVSKMFDFFNLGFCCLSVKNWLCCFEWPQLWWRHQMGPFSALLAICEFTGHRWIPHKGQWRGALMFSLICVQINGWVNNGEAGDLRRYRTHSDVTVMDSLGVSSDCESGSLLEIYMPTVGLKLFLNVC